MTKPGNTDVAALGAGTVAVAVSMMTADGPYDASGVMLAITVALILYGYTWQHHRRLRESVAYGALAGVLAVPVAGAVWDQFIKPGYRDPDTQLLASSFVKLMPIAVWVVFGAFVMAVDVRKNRSG